MAAPIDKQNHDQRISKFHSSCPDLRTMAARNSCENPLWHRFVVGGLGDMSATLLSHPLDVLKYRMQLTGAFDAGKPALTLQDYKAAARHMMIVEGRTGIYAGLSAALLRHSIFSSLRHGLFGVLDRYASERWGPSVASRLLCATTAGFIAGAVANPTDVVLVRMTADGTLEKSKRRVYRHAFDGLSRIASEEGFRTLWRGAGPTIMRASLITASQVTSYETAKEALQEHLGLQSGTFALNFSSAVISGTIACIVTSPFDVIKTRVMQADKGTTPLECVRRTVRSEGPLAFYKGLSATFLRLMPHTVALWLAQEQISNTLKAITSGNFCRQPQLPPRILRVQARID